jgi:hypothetical protein
MNQKMLNTHTQVRRCCRRLRMRQLSKQQLANVCACFLALVCVLLAPHNCFYNIQIGAASCQLVLTLLAPLLVRWPISNCSCRCGYSGRLHVLIVIWSYRALCNILNSNPIIAAGCWCDARFAAQYPAIQVAAGAAAAHKPHLPPTAG